MKKNYIKIYGYMFFILMITILVIILFPMNVKGMEKEEKEQFGLINNPYYEYYNNLSEEEKKGFEVVPSPYLLQKSLIIDKKGIHVQEDKIMNFSARQVLPSKYTLEQDIKIASKNQKNLEICWAFTAFRCLETHLALTGSGYYDFSELHLDYLTSELYDGNRELHGGGNFYDFVNYVQEGSGPILEEELPLQSDVTLETPKESDEMIAKIQNLINSKGLENGNVTPYVTNIVARAFESFDITKATDTQKLIFKNDLKNYIRNNGAVEAYIFFENFLDCYSQENAAFLSKAGIMPNNGHGVNVIGWDDNFPKENFTGKYKPSQDGAWIVSNSWGEDWGRNGYFYISYEDFFFYQYLTGIESAQVVTDKSLDMSIVKLTSFWDSDWINKIQEIVITPILSQPDIYVRNINVNGESLQIQNGKSFYSISKSGTYEIEVIDSQGNSIKKKYIVNKLDIQKPKLEIVANNIENSMQDFIITVNAKDEGDSNLEDYLLIRRDNDEESIWFEVTKDTKYDNTGQLFWSEGFEKNELNKQITASTRYSFFQEGNYTLYVKAVDKAGNESEVESITIFFDRTPPVLMVDYDKSNTGIVTISSNEELQPLEGWIVVDGGLKLMKKYLQSTNEEILVKDKAGNSAIVSINVKVEEKVIFGDVNEDYIINTADVLMVLRYVACSKNENVYQKHPDWKFEGKKIIFADVNQDGKIDLTDVLAINRHIAAVNIEKVKFEHPDWILNK